MNQIITLLKNLLGFGKGHERTNRAKKNITASLVIKGFSIIISLLLVPMTINYLNPARYGVWITLSSIIGWFSFFDIGFGNGLRNSFVEAIAKGEKDLARKYVSTTYAILSIIIGIILGLFLLINPFLNWSRILNTTTAMAGELSILALIVFTFFCIQFVLQLITTILIADQKPAKASLLNLLTSIISLIMIFILIRSTKGSLIYLGISLSLTPLIVLFFSSIWFYTKDYKYYAPSIKFVKFSYAKDLMRLGIKFFFIQISAIILYQCNNIIIAQLFGPAEVTPYNIALKYFGIISMLFSIIITPYWSAYTEAFIKNDILWIKKSIRQIIYFWMFLLVLIILMLIFSNFAYSIWVGNNIKIPLILSFSIAYLVIVNSWSGIFLQFLNGIGKIKLQLYTTIISAIINIPLAIYLGRHFGIFGIVLATCIIVSINAIWTTIQYNKIISNNANGIWNK